MCRIRFVIGLSILVCGILCVPVSHMVYAAAEAEGSIEVGGITEPSIHQAAPELSMESAVERQETVYDYLSAIEKELREYEEKGLIKGTETSSVEYSLEDCLELAVKRHLPIEIAQDKIALHRRKLIKVLRDLFPSLNLSYEHDKGFKLLKADAIPGDHSNQWFRSEKISMALSQPVFRGGTLWNKVNEERALLRAARAEYDKVFLDLSLEVARAYFTYAKARTMLKYKEEILTKANRALEVSEEKMEAELISEIEHLNVQSQQSQIEHDLEAAKEDIALAMVDMQKALHMDVSEALDVETLDGEYYDFVTTEVEKNKDKKNTDESVQEEKLNGLLERAYENRPEFVIQRSKVDAAVYREKQAVGGWLPQANMTFQIGQKAEAYIEDDNNPAWDEEHRVMFDVKWNLVGNTFQYTYDKNRQGTGVEATQPAAGIGQDGYYDRKNSVSVSILDGLDQFVATKEAEIKRKEALLELELSEKDIISEVKESFYNYNRARVQLKSVLKRLTYRKKLVDLAQHRSEINEIQTSEYIQAEIDYINERENLYKAMVDFFVAHISLNKAIGIKDYMPLSGEIAQS